jgi:YidC/Oxa1 family membrane protein insertase
VDKKTIPLVVALVIITIAWPYLMNLLGSSTPKTSKVADPVTLAQAPVTSVATTATDTLPAPLAPETLWVETNKYTVALSTQGGGPVSIQLKEYHYPWDEESNGREKQLIEMIQEPQRAEPQLVFNDGGLNLSDLRYSADREGRVDATSSPQSVTFTFQTSDGSIVQRSYRFTPDDYSFETKTVIPDRHALGIEGDYQMLWQTGLRATELDQGQDYAASFAMAQFNSETNSYGEDGFFGGDWEGDSYTVSEVNDVHWLGKRTKYFAAVMIPRVQTGERVIIDAEKVKDQDSFGEFLQRKNISIAMDLPIDASVNGFVDSTTIYVGPLDWDKMKAYDIGLQEIFDIGTTPVVGWVIRIFAIPIIWLLPKMYDIIPNYGFVIIILGVLIKLITWPLTKKTVRSMAAMKELQPKIEKLKEKHKSNPQAQQQAMMKLYKEAGVNPLASCMPMLMQMPLFFALFRVFNTTILFRGAPFMLWWDDLSRGAVGWFDDPYMILVVILAALMFLQQKVSMTDPRNKAMIYIMPLVFGFMFRTFSSGLVIYWSTFSAFSFVEQLIGNRQRERENAQVN